MGWVAQLRERYAAARRPLPMWAVVLIILAGMASSVAVGYFSPYSTTVPQVVFLALESFVLFCLSAVDVVLRRLPDVLVLIFVAILVPALVTGFLDPLLSVLGLLIGALVPALVAWVIRLAEPEAQPVGGGDIKLLAALGLFLGYKIIYVLGISCLVALLGAGILRLVRGHGDGTFPFGPYLAVATWAMLLIA